MKILISTDFYKHNLGGVTSSVFALCAGLRHHGHEVKVLAMSKNIKSFHKKDDYLLGSIPAYYAPDMRFSFRLNDPLIRELIEWKPDIIHVQSEGSALMLSKKIQKECKIPLVMTSHTDYAYFVFGEAKNTPVIRKFTSVMGKIFYAPAFKIIVPSNKALGFSFLEPYKDRLVVVPNGIELQKYQKSLSAEEEKELRKELSIPENNSVLSAITRLSKEKNIQELIEFLPDILKQMPDTTLLIVGDGPYRKDLEDLVENNHLSEHVKFAGRVAFKNIWRYLALSDIFVSASLFEVHSMSYLEALAQGLPLLCREDDALDGVLEHEVNGFIYNTRSEFTEFALRLLKDEKLRKQFGSKSLSKVEDFSCEKFGERMIRVYEDVIREYRSVN